MNVSFFVSWHNIRQTANITDAQLNARFQGTALYATLLAVIPKNHQPEGYELPPSQAAAVPAQLTLSSRWPGLSQEEMEALVEDYRSEGKQLEGLDLEDEYHKVRELVLHDIMWAS